MTDQLATYDFYGYAVLALLGTLMAVLSLLWLMHRAPWQATLQKLQGVAPPFLNVIGVLFGLMLAFIANDTWNAHDKANHAVHREADALRSLRLLGEPLPQPQRSALHQLLRHYAQSSADEWGALALRRSQADVQASADAILRLVADPHTAQVVGVSVQAQMLRKATELREDRSLRLALSQLHVNPLKWLGMAFLGWLTLLSIAAVHLDNRRAAAVALTLFALSAAPTAAIVLIQGNPFQPPSFVSPTPILATLDAPD